MNWTLCLAAIALFGQLAQFELPGSPNAGDLSGARARLNQETLIEDVEIRGNRRISREMMMRVIKSRPGERYREDQGRKDLDALLAIGAFDPQQTRLTTEPGPRGGVIIIFTVREYPLIRAIQFQGLTSVSEEEITNLLKDRALDLRTESTLTREKVEAARKIISDLLKSKGLNDAKVTAEVESLSPTTVVLTFKITQ